MSDKNKAIKKIIYVVTEDNAFYQNLVETVEHEKYIVKRCIDIDSLEKACENLKPSAIVIEIYLEDEKVRNSECICRMQSKNEKCPPLICVSEDDDIKSRLTIARIGARRYFSKPINITELCKSIDLLTTRELMEPYKALIIDDDVTLLGYYEAVLKDEGINVKTLSNPLQGLKVMSEFKPDVVVIDVYMPECTGPELAQVIRQDESWSTVPIMFLSSEPDAEYQLSVMNLGADDFLVKPVESSYLVAAILARAKRARITNQLNSELKEALRENEFQLVAMDEHDIVSTTDVAGRITSVNEKFCKISGYSQSELIGQDHRMLKSGLHEKEFYNEMWKDITQGKVWHGVICNRKKNGEEYWVESTIVPFLDNKGKPYKFVSARTDITKLRKSEDRLDRSQEYANIGTWDWNIITGELYWSERIWPLFGYTKEITDTTYDNFIEAVYVEDRQMVIDAVTACVEQGADYNIEHRVAWRDGSVHWVLESGDVLRDEKGKALHMLGVVQDIDKRKRAELSLAESELRLREAQEIANIGNWKVDYKKNELSLSDEIYHIFGYEIENKTASMEMHRAAVHQEDLNKVMESEKSAEEVGKYDVTYRIIRPDGEVRYVHELAKVEDRTDGRVAIMAGTVQDISDRYEAEEKLAKQKKLIDMLHKSTTNFVKMGDLKGAMSALLETLLELTESEYGFAGEVLNDEDGSPYLLTHAITNIAWNEKTRKLYDEFSEKGLEFRNMETLFGKVVVSGEVLISNDPATDSRAGGLPEGHPEMNNFMGVPIYYGVEMIGMYGIANRRKDYDDELLSFLQPFDVTIAAMIQSNRMMKKEEENRNEIIYAKEEAENANRSKSRFLSSMSHELRTPMNAIMGFSQLLKMDSSKLSEYQNSSVGEIMKAGNHLLELINEVLDLAKIEEGRIELAIESITLSEVIAESLQLIMPLAQKRGICVNLINNGEESSFEEMMNANFMVLADHSRLRQVLLNLLSNAIKYNNENGFINIACEYVGNAKIRISVTDSGPGISKEDQAMLFKAFNRLGAEQSEIEGTGIGLVITKNIIELMEGAIGVSCEPGEGCTFWVELVRDENAQEVSVLNKEKRMITEEVNSSSNKSAVLYIEDNPANLRLVGQIFDRRENIHMWSAHEPLLGLELAEEHKPDLILLDINLPGMDGYEVLKRLRGMIATQDTPVIAISANAMPGDIEKGMKAGFDDYITKPIDVSTLLEVVDKKLLANN